MKFSIASSERGRPTADAVVLPYFKKEKTAVAAFAKDAWDQKFLSMLEGDFKGSLAEILFSYYGDGIEKKVILLGLGCEKECDGAALRNALSSLAKFCRKGKIGTVNLFLPEGVLEKESLVQAVLDGLSMANYSYDALKKDTLKENPSFFLKEVVLMEASQKLRSLIERHSLVINGVHLAQDLVNGNADDVRAAKFVEVAEGIAKRHSNVKCTILGKKELEKEKMNLLLAVNQASTVDPALVILHYTGDPSSKDLTAFVGKGITYDTGGLNLKPTGGIETMKTDMGGAAAVLGTMQTLASLGIKKNVIGIIAAAENAISAKSYKPGDVYVSHSGKTVEITNTDAEGRLVLADALSYVQKHYDPSRIIDLATLTGGIIVAIGEEATGLFSTSDKLVSQLEKAADATGERVWRMPLFPEYEKPLKSTIADIKNSGGGRKASPCMGGIFLKQFINKKTPWAHLDIAGTSYVSETTAFYPSNATGVGVRLLTVLMENL